MLKIQPAMSTRGADIMIAKLARLREFAPHLRNEDIAAACHVTPQAVSGWRRTGRVDKKHLGRLAELSGTAADWWLDGNPFSDPVPIAGYPTAPAATNTPAQSGLAFYGDAEISRLVAAWQKLSTADQQRTLAELEALAERTQAMFADLKRRESPAAAAFGVAVPDEEVARRMHLDKHPR